MRKTPAEDLENALLPALDVPAEDDLKPSDLVTVEHLEEIGGPQMFDLTDPAIYDTWAFRLIECADCDGTDDWSPFAVIVDGVTAILGQNTARIGEWYARFRSLMTALDVPNALATAHSVMAGGHLMGGVEAMAGPDGLWEYSSDRPDDPLSPRRFSVRPRLGGRSIPPTRVDLSLDGRLTMRQPKPSVPKRTAMASATEISETTKITEISQASESPLPSVELPVSDAAVNGEVKVLDYVSRCNASGYGPSLRDVRENVPGPNPAVDQALRTLVKDRKLDERPRAGRGGGKAYWLAISAESVPISTESEVPEAQGRAECTALGRATGLFGFSGPAVGLREVQGTIASDFGFTAPANGTSERDSDCIPIDFSRVRKPPGDDQTIWIEDWIQDWPETDLSDLPDLSGLFD